MKPLIPAQLTFPPFEIPSKLTSPARKKRPPLGPTAPSHDRVLRRSEVQHVTGLSRTALYRLIAASAFPAQVRLSANTVGWLCSEVDAWIADRVAASRNIAAKSRSKGRS